MNFKRNNKILLEINLTPRLTGEINEYTSQCN